LGLRFLEKVIICQVFFSVDFMDSYYSIRDLDIKEYKECQFGWQCETCSNNLCINLVAVADLPTDYGSFKILGFANNKDHKDHIAVVKGDIYDKEDVLARLHSSCLTGDALKSRRCDCGPQLQKALQMMELEGIALLLYMQQEGRGIGLVNKIKSYQLQDTGLDTYDANLHLGFEPDARDYEVSAAMLSKLGVKSVKLLTNNPDKITQLTKYGVNVSKRIPLEVPTHQDDLDYLSTKKERFGHLLKLDGEH
jgi:3,4-dihydroxy 2-butanone 4-phosphate synthase/GTP cyclohydrolase II